MARAQDPQTPAQLLEIAVLAAASPGSDVRGGNRLNRGPMSECFEVLDSCLNVLRISCAQILDPFRTKFDVSGFDWNFGQPGLNRTFGYKL